jgi:hypothetical protein
MCIHQVYIQKYVYCRVLIYRPSVYCRLRSVCLCWRGTRPAMRVACGQYIVSLKAIAARSTANLYNAQLCVCGTHDTLHCHCHKD